MTRLLLLPPPRFTYNLPLTRVHHLWQSPQESLALLKWQHLLLRQNSLRGNSVSDLPDGALRHLNQRHRLNETLVGKVRFCIHGVGRYLMDISILKCTTHSHPVFSTRTFVLCSK